ncbi:MAG: cupin domain-containing protein [Wenzhouxiangella sp.]|nr:cupin domain-containing protein [Wenzhouxiangella sp.]MDR9453301.1 cupin domain-containing protein [Wenzhouxiangella sp.]
MSKKECLVPIIDRTRQNEAFRDEVITGQESQLVLMTIQPGDEIGAEVHDDHDQILVFVEGEGQAIIDDETLDVKANDLVFVHAGVKHNFINSGSAPLKLYTVYAPPEHSAGTRHETKAEADAAEGHH